MDRGFFSIGALSASVAVGLGAFGAHALRHRLSSEMLTIFEVGVRYQMYHALGLLAVAWALGRWPGSMVRAAGWCFVAATVIFSGSLYLLSLTGRRWLGAVAPLGGLGFIVGWLALAWGVCIR
jgi:uncharacterized membrane protein YgdD (TMEM256/DUF423 family)